MGSEGKIRENIISLVLSSPVGLRPSAVQRLSPQHSASLTIYFSQISCRTSPRIYDLSKPCESYLAAFCLRVGVCKESRAGEHTQENDRGRAKALGRAGHTRGVGWQSRAEQTASMTNGTVQHKSGSKTSLSCSKTSSLTRTARILLLQTWQNMSLVL